MKTFTYVKTVIGLIMLLLIKQAGLCQEMNFQGFIVDDEAQQLLNSLPELQLSEISQGINLPIEVLNNEQPYFPTIIMNQQGSGMCASASGVYYAFAYEMNRARNVPWNNTYNSYDPNFTWNFDNGGSFTGGSWFPIKHLKNIGAVNEEVWGGLNMLDYSRWMSGYDKYYLTHFNKLDESYQFKVDNPDGLDLLKHWLYDHNAGSNVGGVALMACHFGGQEGSLPPESAHSSDKVKLSFDYWNHGVTIVGYCDDVKYDFNGDGQFINGQTMSEWEIGALKIVDSNGPSSGTNGFWWVPYRLLVGNGMMNQNKVIVYEVLPNYSPEIVIKMKIVHTKRDNLNIWHGWGTDANDNSMNDYIISPIIYAGGPNPMQGIGKDPWIEFSLDFGPEFMQEDFGKIFVWVQNLSNPPGILESWSIIDYRWGEEFELYYPETNIVLGYNTMNTFGLPYDLIPSTIEEDLSFNSDMVSRFTSTVSNNSTLTIEDGVNIDMYNSQIVIEIGSTLIIGDNVTITGKTGQNEIVINGNVQIGQNVTFDIGNLILNNQNATVTFDNVSFNNGQLINYCEALDIENSTISYTYIGSHRGFVNLENSTFDHVWTYFTNTVNPVPFYSLSITDCIFQNEAHPGINIDEYDWFYINNNQIYNCNGGGISLFNSGRGPSGNQNILFNDIYNNASSGISIYNSTASVSGNYIHDNQFGVKFFNNSRVAFYGNPNASSYDEMNLVMDNSSYEVYSSGYSFPWYFRYNAIIDEDNLGNPGDPMVYYQWASGDPIPKDIRYNCWGNNFDYHEDLYPDVYLVNPIWCPGGDNQHVPDAAEDMHTSAVSQFEAGNYTDAKNLFEMLIQQYPESDYAQSAMKELFRLEKLTGDDYNSLKQYYRTNDTILADTALTKLGDFLANKCDVKLENWETAIDWYENIIQNPETLEDSIFAIIDLGYTYFLIENSGSRYSFTGTMPEHKPKSMSEFGIKRDELLALLPCSNQFEIPKQNLENLKPGELMQNVPNPFSTSTSIYYRISEPGNVVIRVYDCLGKEQNSIQQIDMNEGIHKIELNVSGLPVGIYYYSLEINGKISGTKKMVVMH
ncbi:MAG: right-handed parallel beta-helix repeat-containing protein [Bacteroidetes bacterium]|nr:right-handed parallel beta-helix repeat-containing protein [Bacteroidota bacterium]